MNGTIKKISSSKFLLVARKWSLRGQNTDYEYFIKWFPKASVITSKKAFKRPYFLLKKIQLQARHDGYSSTSVGMELVAMLTMLVKKPKVIHFWFADHDYHFSWILAKILGIKIVGNFFFSIEELEQRIPDKGHLKHLDMLTSSGKGQMEYLKQYVDPEKIVYLPLGVDTRFFTPPEQIQTRWQRHRTILQVGFNRRDMDTLEKVFKKLQEQFADIRLEMVGCPFVKK